MKPKIHFVVCRDPIIEHGETRLGLCGTPIERAQPVVIVPDAVVVSVGMIADQFGSKMCRMCKTLEPGEGYIYFLATSEFVQELRTAHEYAEAM